MAKSYYFSTQIYKNTTFYCIFYSNFKYNRNTSVTFSKCYLKKIIRPPLCKETYEKSRNIQRNHFSLYMGKQ